VVFLHAVPSANALLRRAGRSERHFLAAYYTQEAAANSTVRRRSNGDMASANMLYYGESKATLRYMWAHSDRLRSSSSALRYAVRSLMSMPVQAGMRDHGQEAMQLTTLPCGMACATSKLTLVACELMNEQYLLAARATIRSINPSLSPAPYVPRLLTSLHGI
jgi:hypothetical protein